MTVFPKSVADDFSMLHTPGKAKSYRPASAKLVPDLGARKVQDKLKNGSLRYVNTRVADTHRALLAVSEMNDVGHDVFFPRSDRNIKAYAYHEGSGTKLELENGVFGLPVELVPCSQSTWKIFFTFYSGTDRRNDGQGCDCGSPKLTGACNCSRSHARCSVATSCQCWVEVLGVATRFVLFQEVNCWEKDQWSQEGDRGQNDKSNCSVKATQGQL